MKDFKEGDEVYFLIEEHGWGSSPCMINNLVIRREKIIDIFDEYLSVTRVEGCFRIDDIYKSKNDVIDALIDQLQLMKK